jgi:electron transfer flavoprotein beta subunit
MEIVVLAKWVPSPRGAPPELGPDLLLTRAEPSAGLDPADEPGIELAVRLAERHGGGVTVVSVGPEPAVAALHRALAFGADAAVLVSDVALRGADALATAKVLAAAVRRRPFDLVVAGVESTDGGTGTLPGALAELLGIPAITFARRVEVADGVVRAERQTARGHDVLECDLPALVSVTAAAAAPRYPGVRDVLRAKKHAIERLSLSDLGLGENEVRWAQRVTAATVAPARAPGEIVDADEAPRRIVRVLEEAGVLS